MDREEIDQEMVILITMRSLNLTLLTDLYENKR